MDNKIYIQLNKLITSNNLSLNDINLLTNYLQRRYIALLVEDRIMHMIDNIGPYLKNTENNPENKDFIDLLPTARKPNN